MSTFTFSSQQPVWLGTASGLNGYTLNNYLPGDQIELTDSTLNSTNLNLTISGNTLTYDDGAGHQYSATVSNLGPGRLVVRNISGGGVDIRLQQDAHNDFNGDSKSDVLWQSSDGTVHDWLAQADASGGFAGNTTNLNVTVPSNWHIVGTGDFNGDARVDVLWRSDDGTVRDWLAQPNGGFIGNTANLNVNVPTNWHIVGTGDFNGDGITDVLWQSDDGTVHDWLGQPNGGFAGNTANLNVTVPSNWRIVGTGDFNGDGHDDILWRSDDGTVHDWLGQPNGGFVGNTANVNVTVPTSWNVVGTGDFNDDGITDILWRNSDGTFHEWLGQSNGTFVANTAFNSTNFNPGTDWHVVGIGDYNGDTIDDLLFRNSSGTTTEWLGQSNGTFVSNTAHVDISVPTNWHVQDPFVHDSLI